MTLQKCTIIKLLQNWTEIWNIYVVAKFTMKDGTAALNCLINQLRPIRPYKDAMHRLCLPEPSWLKQQWKELKGTLLSFYWHCLMVPLASLIHWPLSSWNLGLNHLLHTIFVLLFLSILVFSHLFLFLLYRHLPVVDVVDVSGQVAGVHDTVDAPQWPGPRQGRCCPGLAACYLIAVWLGPGCFATKVLS